MILLSAQPQKPRERLQGFVRDMVLDSFGIGFSDLNRRSDREQQIDNQSMPGMHALGQRAPGFGQRHTAVRP
jgi:hypothetical protein